MRRAAIGMLLLAVPLAVIALIAAGGRGGGHAPVRASNVAPRAVAAAPIDREEELMLLRGLSQTAEMVLRETAGCPERSDGCQRVALGRAATASAMLARFAATLQARAEGRCRGTVGLTSALAGGMAQVARDTTRDARPGTRAWTAGRRAVRRMARRMREVAHEAAAHPACGRPRA